MRTNRSRWLASMVALAISIGCGAFYVLFYFVIPELGIDGLPAWKGSLRFLAPLTLVFAAICYASLVQHRSSHATRLHRAAAGVVGGIAFAFVLHALPFAIPISVIVVATSAMIGAILAAAGIFGVVARGL